MKITAKRKDVLAILRTMVAVIKKPFIYYAACARIEASDKGTFVTAMNSYMRITKHLESHIHRQGIALVPAKMMLDAVTTCQNEDVTFDTDVDHSTHVQSGTLSYSIKGLEPDTFPNSESFDEHNKIVIPYETIKNGFRFAGVAVANQKVGKPALENIYLHTVAETICIVGTDGRRLSTYSDDLVYAETKIIIPITTVDTILKNLPVDNSCEVHLNEKAMIITFEGTEIQSSVFEGTYPQYKAVIPDSFEFTYEFYIHDFIEKISAVSVINNEQISITFDDNSIFFETYSEETGSAKDVLELDDVSFPAARFKLNPIYVLDGLKNIAAERFWFRWNEPVKPIAFSQDNYTYIIMPLRD